MNARIDFDNRAVQAEFSDCILHTTGEFAGNLDFSVRFSHPVSAKDLTDNLRLRLPGTPRLLDVVGYRTVEDGYEITMHSVLAPPGEDIPHSAVPANVEAFWLKQDTQSPLGTLAVNLQTDADDLGQPAGCVSTVLLLLSVPLVLLIASAALE